MENNLLLFFKNISHFEIVVIFNLVLIISFILV